ncbi:hypothetical protein C8R46DRAFT_1078742 [Mycena filopes]|nr:hypothetical protein C8R46DRAFT_1078742 [Mycena filopes]
MVRSGLISDSPFLALWEQGRVPLLEERHIIEELLEQKSTQLAELNARVRRIPKRSGATTKKLPRALRVDLEETRRIIKFHRALLAPWRCLPVEIMGEIFLSTLANQHGDKNSADEHDQWNDDRTGTLLLCKICREWRRIAITTPSLWNVLSLTLQRNPLDWLSTWLDRSRAFPLYLQVFWDDRALPEVINTALSVFHPHLHHTATLWLDGMDLDDLSLVVDSYPTATFPHADSFHAPLLSVVGADLPPNSAWDWIRGACQASPCLTKLTLAKFDLDWFPVENLTKIHLIEAVSMSTVFQVLERAPGLQQISFDIEGPCVTPSGGSVLVLPSMSSTEVTSREHLAPFLDQISCPGLANIAIHQIEQWPVAEFQSFLSRSACKIKSFNLYDVRISENHVIECLTQSALTDLQILSIAECRPPVGRALLQHLTYDAHPFPCPHLTSIGLSDISAADGLFATLVESRFSALLTVPPDVAAPARLEKVDFAFQGGTFMARFSHKQDWSRLEALDGDDSELEIRWPAGNHGSPWIQIHI